MPEPTPEPTPTWLGGDGPLLLHLHGLDGVAGDRPGLEVLGRRFRVLAPVHAGFDGSPRRAGPADPLDDLLALMALLRSRGERPAAVVGHCFGALAAAALVAAWPTEPPRLVLISPLGLWREGDPVPDLFAHQAARTVDPDHADGNLAAAADHLWPLPDGRLERLLPRVEAPTLLVLGEDDPRWSGARTARCLELLADGRADVLPGVDASPLAVAPEELARRIARFVGEAP